MDALLRRDATLRRKANRECQTSGLAFGSDPEAFEKRRIWLAELAQLFRAAYAEENQSRELPSTILQRSANDRRVLAEKSSVIHRGRKPWVCSPVLRLKRTTVE